MLLESLFWSLLIGRECKALRARGCSVSLRTIPRRVALRAKGEIKMSKAIGAKSLSKETVQVIGWYLADLFEAMDDDDDDGSWTDDELKSLGSKLFTAMKPGGKKVLESIIDGVSVLRTDGGVPVSEKVPEGSGREIITAIAEEKKKK